MALLKAGRSSGQRRVMMLGLVASALGGLLGAASMSGTMLLVSRAVESFGFIATVLPGPALLTRLVPGQRLRPVMGLWACYMPLGMSIVLVLCPWLLDAVGWRGIWIGIAVISMPRPRRRGRWPAAHRSG